MSQPPLAYSYASFSRDGYDDHVRVIDMISQAGFRWITLTPTYRVTEPWDFGTYVLRIDDSHTPTIDRIKAAADYAARKGLNIRLDPHLDWAATFDGGDEDWRRRMYFNPDDSSTLTQYDQRVAEPMMDVVVDIAARYAERCFALTLGSELDVSLLEFATGTESWASLLATLQARRTISGLDNPVRVAFGQKINHDTLSWDATLVDSLNEARDKRGLTALTAAQVNAKKTQVYAYFSSLDYVSFSFYPVIQFRKPDSTVADDSWWRGPTTQADIDAIASSLKEAADDLRSILQQNTSPTPAFNIGEFGLGSTDPEHSYRTDYQTFLDADGHIDSGAREMRRKFYLGFLRFLELSGNDFSDVLIGMDCRLPQTFWTTGHYDFLGRESDPPLNEFRDNRIIEAVRQYAGVSPSGTGSAPGAATGGSPGIIGPGSSSGGSVAGSGSGSAAGSTWTIPRPPGPLGVGVFATLPSVASPWTSFIISAPSADSQESGTRCKEYNGPPRHVVCIDPYVASPGDTVYGRLLDRSIDFTQVDPAFLQIRMTMVWYGGGPAGAITGVIPGRYIRVLGRQELEFDIPRGQGFNFIPSGQYEVYFYYWPHGWSAPSDRPTIDFRR